MMMSIVTIILMIVALALLALLGVIFFFLWQKKRLATGKPSEDKAKEIKVWWAKIKPLATDISVVIILMLVFTEQVKGFIEEYPKIAAALVLSFVVVSLTGPYNPKIRRKIGILCLIVFLVFGIFWPAATEKFPELKTIFDNLDPIKPAAYRAAPSVIHLPPGAKLKATLEPGEIREFALKRPDLAPPKLWVKYSTALELTGPWPTGKATWTVRNSYKEAVGIYMHFPAGQEIAGPAPAKQ